jgi:probable rRNA maturation factor
MTVDISAAPRTDVDTDDVARFARSVLDAEGVDADASLSISFVDVERIAELNEEYMGKSGPTDVLSFPIEDAAPGVPPRRPEGGPPLELGDIVVCADVVQQHADEFDVSFDDELHLMICHGVLHILGWDHQTDAEAERMEAREAEHLGRIGRTRR